MKTLLFGLILTPLITLAQIPDTLLFHSTYEQNQFAKAKKDEVDPIGLFIGFDAGEEEYANAMQKLDQFYRVVETLSMRKKSEKQFAKSLFTTVHGHFLRKYEDSAPFSLIFKNGYYNCVSATALFAIILDHYGVPYDIKEVPTHVYLIAYPGTHNIIYETTNPQGFYAPDNKTKENYVNGMVKAKLTTQEHVNSVGYNKVFEELYYPKDNISLIQLSSFQYSNKALSDYRDKKTEPALVNMFKAYELNPSTRNEFLKLSLIGSQLGASQMNGMYDPMYLIEFGNTVKDKSQKQEVVESFRGYLHQKLMKQANDSALISTYELLKSGIRDSSLRSEIGYYYNLGLAQWYGVKGRVDESLKYSSQAYAYNKNDLAAQELIIMSVLRKFMGSVNKGDIERLDAFKVQFPFLADNLYFVSLYASSYAFKSATSFEADQGDEGYSNLKLLRQELDKHGKDLMINEHAVAMVFAEAGAYHFRLKQYNKAIEIMQEGFKYAPDDPELKTRIKIVEDEPK